MGIEVTIPDSDASLVLVTLEGESLATSELEERASSCCFLFHYLISLRFLGYDNFLRDLDIRWLRHSLVREVPHLDVEAIHLIIPDSPCAIGRGFGPLLLAALHVLQIEIIL